MPEIRRRQRASTYQSGRIASGGSHSRSIDHIVGLMTDQDVLQRCQRSIRSTRCGGSIICSQTRNPLSGPEFPLLRSTEDSPDPRLCDRSAHNSSNHHSKSANALLCSCVRTAMGSRDTISAWSPYCRSNGTTARRMHCLYNQTRLLCPSRGHSEATTQRGFRYLGVLNL